MIVPETAIVYRQLNALGRLMGASFRLLNNYVSIQREVHRFRSVLNSSELSQRISSPILYAACFIDTTINSVIGRILLSPDAIFNVGNYFSKFPYAMFSAFTIVFVCMDPELAHKKVTGTVYLLVINCLSIVLDAASKSLLSELFYLRFGVRMLLPFILCFCGTLFWRTILRGFIVAFAQSDAERTALFKKNFAPDPHTIRINSSFARGFIFAVSYSIFRPIFGASFTQVFCALGDCCNIFVLVAYYMRTGSYETDDLYTLVLRYICNWIQKTPTLPIKCVGEKAALPI